MGDIVQSAILLKNIKKFFPDSEITYLLLDNFKKTSQLIPEIDKVIAIDFSMILQEIDSLNFGKALSNIDTLLCQLTEEYDEAVNLSFSKLSAYILHFVKAKKKRGLLFSKQSEFLAYDEWSRFFLAIVEHRHLSPFNLVDIYKKIGLGDCDSACASYTNCHTRENVSSPVFGFVLGASTYDRQWPPESFAELAKLIIKNYPLSKVFLLGTKEEKLLSDKFFAHINSNINIIDCVGKTSLSELYDLIDKINILVTNDTGTMHLGWFRGKKVVELSLGPALYNTTGPYGNGHIVFQPDIECAPCNYTTKCKNLKCHTVVTPDAVFSAIRFINCESDNIKSYPNIKILESYFDERGFVSYKKISKDNDNDKINYNSFKNIWINTLEKCLKKNNKYINKKKIRDNVQILLSNITALNKLVHSVVELIDVGNKNTIEKEVQTILEFERYLREHIYSNLPEFIPFWKYLEYTKNLLPDNDLKNNLSSLKELYEIFYIQILNAEEEL